MRKGRGEECGLIMPSGCGWACANGSMFAIDRRLLRTARRLAGRLVTELPLLILLLPEGGRVCRAPKEEEEEEEEEGDEAVGSDEGEEKEAEEEDDVMLPSELDAIRPFPPTSSLPLLPLLLLLPLSLTRVAMPVLSYSFSSFIDESNLVVDDEEEEEEEEDDDVNVVGAKVDVALSESASLFISACRLFGSANWLEVYSLAIPAIVR